LRLCAFGNANNRRAAFEVAQCPARPIRGNADLLRKRSPSFAKPTTLLLSRPLVPLRDANEIGNCSTSRLLRLLRRIATKASDEHFDRSPLPFYPLDTATINRRASLTPLETGYRIAWRITHLRFRSPDSAHCQSMG